MFKLISVTVTLCSIVFLGHADSPNKCISDTTRILIPSYLEYARSNWHEDKNLVRQTIFVMTTGVDYLNGLSLICCYHLGQN